MKTDSFKTISNLKAEWLSSVSAKDGNSTFRPDSVTQDGRFELWTDTGHGSGLTYTADMTEEQQKIHEAFLTLESFFIDSAIREKEYDLKRAQSEVDSQERELERLTQRKLKLVGKV